MDETASKAMEFYPGGPPQNVKMCGSQAHICHTDRYRINPALIEKVNALPDFRESDNVRLGLAQVEHF